ncbi:alpha/beta fold hydrolase [Amycolatopsis cihanbeyliensis]|uniref:Pimeloyl-ACP methyl ester carboxylesterase n=1 Tax=Amycolatopsis cihanbeyliensis TaxID=1128664 RepID=A0A542DIL3_AMYCI|nr:alpha/beta hydrolase [Amycolatopsis cihanbeyliensis]TQJ02941.1 pimeloyl-ACP methyl ester carboxylesterase [Amycolatopsis cihanbeyliensis]
MSTSTATGTWRLTRRVRVSGGEAATAVFGEGPPVVLVHGAPASSYLWRAVAASLARRHTVYLWDLLGFGESWTGPGSTPSIAEQARALAELLEHWGLEAPGLVGHDIGGGVVLRAHLLHGVPARRLALLDAAVLDPWITPFTEHMQRYEDAYRTMPPHVFADIIAARLRTATRHPLPEAVFEAYLAPWAGSAGQQRWIDQVAAVRGADTRAVADRLAEITVPALVLWGERDQWLPPDTGSRLAAAIPGARRVIIRDAGHFLPEDNPHDTTTELLRFLG